MDPASTPEDIMKKRFEHFILQDLVDEHIESVLRWIGRDDLTSEEHRFRKVDSVMRVHENREIRTDNAWLIQGPTRTIVSVEVQHTDKMWRCDEYLAFSASYHRANAILILLTPDAAVARWAKKHLAMISRARGRPYVLGPQDVPVQHPDFIPREALQRSLLLAAIGQHEEMFHHLWEEAKHRYLTNAFDQNAFHDYIELLERTAPATWIRDELEVDMEFVSSIERAKQQGRDEGRDEEREEILRLQRQSVRDLARAEGITLTPESNARLDAATDLSQFTRWLIQVSKTDQTLLTLSNAED